MTQYVIKKNGKYLTGRSSWQARWVSDLSEARVYKNTGNARSSAKQLLRDWRNPSVLDGIVLQPVELSETNLPALEL